MSADDELDWQGLIAHTGLSRSTLNHHLTAVSKSPLPAPTMIFGRLPTWKRPDIDRWMAERDTKRGPARVRMTKKDTNDG